MSTKSLPNAIDTKREPMLAWWCLFPGLALIAIQWRFSVPPTQMAKNAADDSYVVGYLVGSALVAGGMALLAAWIAYRAAGRKRLPASLTFLCVCLFLCLVTLQTWASTRAQNALRAVVDEGPTSYGAFEFEVPAGWINAKPNTPQSLATLIWPGRKPGEPAGIISVEVDDAILSARELAEKLTRHGGRLLPDAIQIDDVEAFRYEADSNDLSEPRHAVAFVRGGKAYLIMAYGIEEMNIPPALDHVLKTWRWTNPN